jgi:hypothetical protein
LLSPGLAHTDLSDEPAAAAVGLTAREGGDLAAVPDQEPEAVVIAGPQPPPILERRGLEAPQVFEGFSRRGVPGPGVRLAQRLDRESLGKLGIRRLLYELYRHLVVAARLAVPPGLEQASRGLVGSDRLACGLDKPAAKPLRRRVRRRDAARNGQQ